MGGAKTAYAEGNGSVSEGNAVCFLCKGQQGCYWNNFAQKTYLSCGPEVTVAQWKVQLTLNCDTEKPWYSPKDGDTPDTSAAFL